MIKKILQKHGVINGMSIHSTTQKIESELYEAIEDCIKFNPMDEQLNFIYANHLNYKNPEFKNKPKIYDWINYIPNNWADNWHKFTEREQKIIAEMSAIQTNNK